MLTMQNQQDLDEFIKNISPSLALRVRGHMFESVLKDRNKIIKDTQLVIMRSASSNSSSKAVAVPGAPVSDSQKRAQKLLGSIIVTLGNSLQIPDEEIITQDDFPDEENLAMFFVGSGNCKVKVRDHHGREQIIGNLNEGDHFGELALIYKCKRSATVISNNYNTFARIIKPRFREITSEFPEYEACLKENALKSYRDKKI